MLEIKPIFSALLRSKAGAVMLLVQIAITVAIVSNAAFIIDDRIEYLQQETGYPEDELFSVSVMTFGEDVNILQKIEENEAMLRSLPGVINATSLSEIPLSGSGSSGRFFLTPDADPISGDDDGTRSAFVMGDEHTINTLGVTIVEGRDFRREDVVYQESTDLVPNVVITSQAFANARFPEGDALGKTFYFGPYPVTIIGIVDTMKGPWLKDSSADSLIVMPLIRDETSQKFMIRTEASQRAMVMAQVEDLMLNDYDKRVVTQLRGLDQSKQEYNAEDILMMRMLVVLIVVLVMVTALGIFGLTVFNINKRTKQIGTRRALGARKSHIIKYFLVENCMICLVGIAIGSIAAIYLGQVLLTHYELPRLDSMYILWTTLSVLAISLLSVLLPANKAANISPSIATRSV